MAISHHKRLNVLAALRTHTHVLLTIVGCCVLLLLVSCSRGSLGIGDISNTEVPSVAPDTVPANLVEDTYGPGSAVRDIVMILFKDGATHQERRHAVRAISGVVVGGMRRLSGEEGWYYVRVRPTASHEELLRVVSYARTLPGIESATDLVPFYD